MAALLTRMERDGLIARAPHPGDKRASRISLTARAKRGLPQAKDAMREIVDQAFADFEEDERAMVLQLLRRVVKNLGESVET